MDFGERDGRSIATRRQVYKDGERGFPEITPVNIIKDTVTAVVGRLLGGAGPGGTDSVSLQHWMLQFGAASAELRLIVGDFVEWLGNGRPHWDAYRALMSGQLITLDKQPGIRTVGVGETWR